PVAVRAPGFAPWSGSATVKVGETTATDVALQREAVVVGAVRLPSGGPASRATVIGGSFGDFLSSWTRSDEDGSLRLPGLRAGKNAIQATVKGAGKAEAELDLIEGAE